MKETHAHNTCMHITALNQAFIGRTEPRMFQDTLEEKATGSYPQRTNRLLWSENNTMAAFYHYVYCKPKS